MPVTRQNVKVTNLGGGVISPTSTAVTLKNQIKDITSLTDIPGVIETNLVDGATLQYNAITQQFDIEPFVPQSLDIDGGIF